MERVKQLLWHKSDRALVQFVRYGLVAAIGLVVDFGGLVLLKEVFGVHYVLAATISFVVALVVNYALSIWWVFPKSQYSRRREFMMFGVIGLVGLGINDLMLWALTSGLGVHYMWSKVITTVGVFFWNFFARKAIFTTKPKPALPET
jgi:putative flippase GtrA